MDEQEKPFDTVSIVLLLTIAGFSDAADLGTDLIFPVPVIGQVIYLCNSFLISPLTWAIIQGLFIMKTSGGRMPLSSLTNLIPVAGGLGNIANIPGSETVTTLIAIWMANHPKTAVLTVAAGAAIATGGAGTAAAGATEGTAGGVAAAETGAGAAAARTETATAGAAAEAEAGTAAAGAEETGGLGKTGAEAATKEIPPEALGEEKSPFEKLQELTEKTPDSGRSEERSGNKEQERAAEGLDEKEYRKKDERGDVVRLSDAGRRRNAGSVMLSDNTVHLEEAA